MRRNFDYLSGTVPEGDTVTKRGERTCPMCWKEFVIHCALSDWGYQGPMPKKNKRMPGNDKTELFCSYSCMRKAEKELNIPRDLTELEEAMKAAEERRKLLDSERMKRRYQKIKKALAELDEES